MSIKGPIPPTFLPIEIEIHDLSSEYQYTFTQPLLELNTDLSLDGSIYFLFDAVTGWTNVNLLYLPDSIEIVSLEGLTLWCAEINQLKKAVGIVMHDFHGLKTDLPPRCRHCLFLTCSYRYNPIFYAL